jgi:hyaluronate lyase
LYSDLSSTQRTNYLNALNAHVPATLGNTGANYVWYTQIFAMIGALEGGTAGDSRLTEAAGSGIPNSLDWETTLNTDGFFSDGSYIAHQFFGVPGGYGAAYYQTLAGLLHTLRGSVWYPTADPDEYNIVNWAFNTYFPMIYKGAMFDTWRGRDIGLAEETDHNAAGWIISAMLLALDTANTTDAARLKSQLKQWFADDPGWYTDTYTSVFSILRAEAIANDAGVTASGGQTVAHQYPLMARTAVQRPAWALGVSMFGADTVHNYENILGVNNEGWHQADGTTLLYVGNDIDQYRGNYWATVNAYRLPGATSEHTTEPSTYNNDSFAGGTTDGTNSASGMILAPHFTTLSAKKSWFAFDNEIVALGSNISSSSSAAVETTVDNRKLNASGNNAFTVDGTAQSTSVGWSSTLSGVRWMNLAGNVSGADLGYYFPSATTVKAARILGQGAWSDQSDGESSTILSNDFMNLWIDHGVGPTSGSYAYVLLPGMNATQTQAYRNSPDVTILKQDGNVHAVKESTTGMIAANFWTNSTQSFNVGSYTPWLTSDSKASVLATDHQVSGTWYTDLWAADPTTENTGTMTLTLGYLVASVVSADPGVTVTRLTATNQTQISINANGSRGKTFHVQLAD